MTDWEPIDTAPKDGTRILVYSPLENDYCWKVRIDRWRDGWWYHSPRPCPPTHWMPLPEEPKQ